MAQLPTQPWEADEGSDDPDRLDEKWGSITQDIKSNLLKLSKTIKKLKESSGLAIWNIEFSAASAQQKDKEMFLLLHAARDILSEMELRFRKMQDKPSIITKKDVNDATTARQTLDKVLSISCYETDSSTDQLLPYPTLKEEELGELKGWLCVEGDIDIQVSEEEDSVHQSVKL